MEVESPAVDQPLFLPTRSWWFKKPPAYGHLRGSRWTSAAARQTLP